MQTKLVGMQYRPPALDLVERIPDGTQLLLIREPGNIHDPNAVAVYWHIGYVPASAAAKLAPRMDNAASGLRATLTAEFAYNPGWPRLEIPEPEAR